MFTFLKSKPVLKDLIPDNYIDIHSHLLPGIDDGSKSIKDTLRLTQSLQDIGFSAFITTPHVFSNVWNNTTEIIQKTEKETLAALRGNQFEPPFHAAAEYLLDDHFLQLCKAGDLLTLKKNYVLVEMSYINPPIQLYSILFDLQVAGYIPVLAHPERYLFYSSNFDEYQKLKNAGCLFQLNLLSTIGYYGEAVTKMAEKLLQKGMYNFVGSDLHHFKHLAGFDQKIKIKDCQPLKEVIAKNIFFKQD
jgi:tyrosine-protein phosphatase YwqE